jgi:hypothetical protein
LTGLVQRYVSARRPIGGLPEWLVGEAEERNGGPLADDVAMLLLTSEPSSAGRVPATGAGH